jgi:hypothetical protein
MEDLTDRIKRYYEHFKKDCACGERCWCERRAVIWSHIDTTIPDEYRQFTIDDFTGEMKLKDGKKQRILPEDVVVKARRQVVDYCWRDVEDGEEYGTASWLRRTMLDRRFLKNESLVIYGARWVTDRASPGSKPFQKPFGRTMIAAIVMKEVIFLRWLEGHLGDTYEWADFTTLMNRLMRQADGSKEYDSPIFDCQEADWLCIDNISVLERATDLQRNYRASVLDRLLCERREAGKPNILVFQDNIQKIDDLQSEFGSEIARIINSQKTHKVALIG